MRQNRKKDKEKKQKQWETLVQLSQSLKGQADKSEYWLYRGHE